MRRHELTPPRSCYVWPNGVPAANQAAYANFESYRYKFDPRDANAACVNVSAQLAWNTYNHSMYASYTNYTRKRRSLLQEESRGLCLAGTFNPVRGGGVCLRCPGFL